METEVYNKYKKTPSGQLISQIVDRIRAQDKNRDINSAASILWASYVMKKEKIDSHVDLLNHIKNNIKDDLMKDYLLNLLKNEEIYLFSKDIMNGSSKETIIAEILFGTTQYFSSMGRYLGENITPDSIIQLAIELLELESEDVVYDATSGTANFLIESAIQKGVKELYGTELNRDSIILSKIKAHVLNLELNIDLRDSIESLHNISKPSKVFSNYPFGMRARDLEKSINENKELIKYLGDTKVSSGDWIFAISAMLSQETNGKTIVVMTSGSLINDSEREIREKLIREGKIEAVITLPPRLFSTTSIPIHLIVFSNNNSNVRLINAVDQYSDLNRSMNYLSEKDIHFITDSYHNLTEISKDIDIKNLEKEDFVLSPVRYMGEILNEEDGVPLSEVAIDIIRGAMISKKELDELSDNGDHYKILQVKDIEDGLISQDLPAIVHIDEKFTKACIQNGDVLMSKTAPFKLAVVNINKDEKIIATGNMYILRINQTKIDPYYLCMFLQSRLGQEQIKRYVAGTTIQTISVSALSKIIIPEKKISEQTDLANEFREIQEDLMILEKQKKYLHNKQREFLEEVF